MSVYRLFVGIAVSHNARDLENGDFPKGKCIFSQNLIFRNRCPKVSKLNPKTIIRMAKELQKPMKFGSCNVIKNSLKHWRFSNSKSGKSMKITLPKTLFFSLAFCNGFGWVWTGFWEGFGKGFGIFLASLGPLLAAF